MRSPVALLLVWCTACASLPSSPSAVVELERARFAAMTRQDMSALEPMLGEDLVYCHSHGQCETKTEFLETVRTGRIRYRAIEVIELRARAAGAAVVVNGSMAVQGLVGGEPRNMRVVFTDVYTHRQGRWQLIAWQSTRLP